MMFWKKLAALMVLTTISSMALTNHMMRTADSVQDSQPPKDGTDPDGRSEMRMSQKNVSAETDTQGTTISVVANENDDMEQSDENAAPRALLSARSGDEDSDETMGKGCTNLCKCAEKDCDDCQNTDCQLVNDLKCIAQVAFKCAHKLHRCNDWKKKAKKYLKLDCAMFGQEEENSTKELQQDTDPEVLKDGKNDALDESLQGKRSC